MKNLPIFLLTLLFFTLTGCQIPHFNNNMTPPAPSPSAQKARANAAQVLNYLRQGYTDKAQEKLELALAEAANDPVVLDVSGYYYEKTGRLNLANHYFRLAVITSPRSGIVKNNYGAFLCRNGYYQESVPYFLAAAKTPGTPIAEEAQKNANYCRVHIKSRLGVGPT